MGQHATLDQGMLTVTWTLFKCNSDVRSRGEVDEHCTQTHGVKINRMKRETTIKVYKSSELKLASCHSMSEQSNEKRKQLMESWYYSCASTGTITNTARPEVATLQYHKSADFLAKVKTAVGVEFYNKFYFDMHDFQSHQ